MATYRVVKLLKNDQYPTYQLYAQMANEKTSPAEGLQKAVSCILDWLLQRLGENAPTDLRERIEAGEIPFSYHISQGYVIDIVSLPERGTWSLLISEPDLGSDPGNPKQARSAIPGRIIETNIGFCISGKTLECGFQTVISDPMGTTPDAEVYRFAPIRQLMEDPSFGLRQITELKMDVQTITSQDGLKVLLSTWQDERNQLPLVIFTEAVKETGVPDLSSLPSLSELAGKPGQLPGLAGKLPIPPKKPEMQEPPYNAKTFAKYCFTFCRTFSLSHSLLDKLCEALKKRAQAGEIVVLEPLRFGGSVQILPCPPLKKKRDETFDRLVSVIQAYPRRKLYDFGGVPFLTTAHRHLLDSGEENLKLAESEARAREAQFIKSIEQLQEELRSAHQQNADLQESLERQKRYQKEQDAEKASLRAEIQKAQELAEERIREKDERIAYLLRKLSQPKEHTDIAEWIRAQFSDRLVMHPKAVDLLAEKTAKNVSIELICDALDFLATDYWDYRYSRISKEEMNTRCSEKYGRPFEIKPTGTQTVQYTPVEYKIKYFPGQRGKPVESALDYHLCVGSDVENLLRIYFLHDDDKKLIVIGSLPHHLRAVTIE